MEAIPRRAVGPSSHNESIRPFFQLLIPLLLLAQEPAAPPKPVTGEEAPVEFICPMDKEIRQAGPGKCPRCGMALVPGIPDPHEYPVRLKTEPRIPVAGRKTLLEFTVEDPKSRKPVRDFTVMHEKLFHLFLISQDLSFFQHVHPEQTQRGSFQLAAEFPKAGMYRTLADFYPQGGTPQLVANTLIVPGPNMKIAAAALQPDISPKTGENLSVTLRTEPDKPLAGFKTLMFFQLDPLDGLEPYLAAWGHMLSASSDLIDLMHSHPIYVDGQLPDLAVAPKKGEIQFNMIFPRAGVYRVWVQFQRKGVVNTIAFNIPVDVLK
jgi:hypothetical protein